MGPKNELAKKLRYYERKYNVLKEGRYFPIGRLNHVLKQIQRLQNIVEGKPYGGYTVTTEAA